MAFTFLHNFHQNNAFYTSCKLNNLSGRKDIEDSYSDNYLNEASTCLKFIKLQVELK
jgi:hypothetical protein